MVKNMKGLGQNILDARFSLGKFLWLAVTHCLLSPRQLPGAKETRFCPFSPDIPPMAPMGGTINIFDLWGVQFYWGKILSNANLKKLFDEKKLGK